MNRREPLSGCACCRMSRRRFLATGCAACAGAAGISASRPPARAAQDTGKVRTHIDKVRIRIIYALHEVKQPGPDWPNVGFDFGPVMERTNKELAKQCPGFEFIPSMAKGPEAAEKILNEDKSAAIDGYLVYQMNCWNNVVKTILTSGKPVLYADFQYGGSGGFLVSTAGFLRGKTPNLGFVASSRMEDLAEAVKCFELVKKGAPIADFVAATARVRADRTRKPGDLSCKADALKTLSPQECLRRLKRSKILAIGGRWPGIAPMIKRNLGIEVVNVPFAELDQAWNGADKDESRAIADRWEKTAARIEEVSRKTLVDSAAMYLAKKEVMKKRGANAITIGCLGGFYGGHIHAYPCLGFHELNNEGMIGACECDLRSAATMVVITALTQGRPGMISDPVIDTSKRQIIYAHCVAPNRMFGPQGQANPFDILTHSEDRKGASVRSKLPLGYMTTTVEFGPARKEILFHQGKTVENVVDDRACRTKLAVEPVGDLEKLFTEWDRWSWHRVTVYGDLKEPVFALADALGWKVVEEA